MSFPGEAYYSAPTMYLQHSMLTSSLPDARCSRSGPLSIVFILPYKNANKQILVIYIEKI